MHSSFSALRLHKEKQIPLGSPAARKMHAARLAAAQNRRLAGAHAWPFGTSVTQTPRDSPTPIAQVLPLVHFVASVPG